MLFLHALRVGGCLCYYDRQSAERLGWDFSEKKITANTKHRRDAKLRAKAIKQEISIKRPQPHALQRLYFSAFAPSALETMVKSKLRPACCSIYSFLTLNCIIASGIAKVSNREILEKLKLSDKNALSYFKELENTALIVDKSNHRNRKKESRFYLPHTHQHAKDIFNNQENTSILGGGDWVLMTPEAIEKLTKQKKLRGTHWYVYAYLCLNTYRETGITMKALPKARVMEDLNLSVNRKAVYRVFKTLEELGLIIQEEHKKDVCFLPNILLENGFCEKCFARVALAISLHFADKWFSKEFSWFSKRQKGFSKLQKRRHFVAIL